MLTGCDLSQLSEDIQNLAALTSDRRYIQKETDEVRMAIDEADVKLLQRQLEQFNPFCL